jgi:hypothetical protein
MKPTQPRRTRIRVGEPPEDGIDSRLACPTKGLLGFQDHAPVVITQLHSQCLQLTSRITVEFIAHCIVSFLGYVSALPTLCSLQ